MRTHYNVLTAYLQFPMTKYRYERHCDAQSLWSWLTEISQMGQTKRKEKASDTDCRQKALARLRDFSLRQMSLPRKDHPAPFDKAKKSKVPPRPQIHSQSLSAMSRRTREKSERERLHLMQTLARGRDRNIALGVLDLEEAYRQQHGTGLTQFTPAS